VLPPIQATRGITSDSNSTTRVDAVTRNPTESRKRDSEDHPKFEGGRVKRLTEHGGEVITTPGDILAEEETDMYIQYSRTPAESESGVLKPDGSLNARPIPIKSQSNSSITISNKNQHLPLLQSAQLTRDEPRESSSRTTAQPTRLDANTDLGCAKPNKTEDTTSFTICEMDEPLLL
jgi:hypothetical protein